MGCKENGGDQGKNSVPAHLLLRLLHHVAGGDDHKAHDKDRQPAEGQKQASQPEKAEAENEVNKPRQQQPGAGRFVQLHELSVELVQPQLAQGIFDGEKQKADKGKQANNNTHGMTSSGFFPYSSIKNKPGQEGEFAMTGFDGAREEYLFAFFALQKIEVSASVCTG